MDKKKTGHLTRRQAIALLGLTVGTVYSAPTVEALATQNHIQPTPCPPPNPGRPPGGGPPWCG